MTEDNFDIPAKGLEKIPEKVFTSPDHLEQVSEPAKPEANVDLDIEDLVPVVEKELSNSLSETLKSGWTIKNAIGIVLTLLTFLSLFIIGKCS